MLAMVAPRLIAGEPARSWKLPRVGSTNLASVPAERLLLNEAPPVDRSGLVKMLFLNTDPLKLGLEAVSTLYAVPASVLL